MLTLIIIFNVSNPQLNRVYKMSELRVDVVWVPHLGSFDIIDEPLYIYGISKYEEVSSCAVVFIFFESSGKDVREMSTPYTHF